MELKQFRITHVDQSRQMVKVIERSKCREEGLGASSRNHQFPQEQSEHACKALGGAHLSACDREAEAANQILPKESHYQSQVCEMRAEEQRSHLEAILRDQATSSDERIRALAESSHGQLVAAR